MTSSLRCSTDGEIRVLTITSGPKVNPLSEELQRELLKAFEEVALDPSVRAVVLTGEGNTFCVGADLSLLRDVGTPGVSTSVGSRVAEVMGDLTNPLVITMRRSAVPIVCALNGAAAGAGVGLSLASDLLIAARSAYFYLPFVPRLGIVPDMGASWFILRQIGIARATALALLDERLSAAQATEWGLAYACVDDDVLMTQAMALARRLAALPAHAVSETRRLFDAAGANSLPEQLEFERSRQRELLDRPEFEEGVRAFMDRRVAVFPPRGVK